MTLTRKNPLAALVSVVAAAALAFGLAPAPAFANPDNLSAVEKATRLADAAETPVMTIDVGDDAETVLGETLLTFEDDADVAAFIQESARRDGLSAEVLIDDLEGATIVTVTSANVASTSALIHVADEIDGVAAQPNYVYRLPNELAVPEPIGETAEALAADDDEPTPPTDFPNDPYAATYQYQFLPVGDGASKSGSNILEAWNLVRAQTERTPVSVGVIDSGVNMTHEDLQDNIDYDHAYDVNTGDADVTDLIGHGSMSAGIIAATSNNGKGVAGVADAAPGMVSVIPVKVFTDSGETDTSTVIDALDYVDGLIEDGVVDNLRIINMSLGMRGDGFANLDHALYRSVSHLTYDHGVLVVGAGGNGDDDNQAIMDPMYPSDYEACLSVTALTETGANAYFSDYNQYKDISAPGMAIAGPSDEGNSYVLSAGTSDAALIVSGVATLMLAVDPTLSPAEIIDIVKSTAVPIPDRSENDWCELSGSAGALDAGGALRETIKRMEASVPAETADVYRLYNPLTGEHLHTLDPVERTTLVAGDWNDEGVGWTAPVKSNTPVYRLYNPDSGEHLYTGDGYERSVLLNSGWNDEGVGFYSDANRAVPVYRLYNPAINSISAHHFTSDFNERTALVDHGWRSEGVAWYAVK